MINALFGILLEGESRYVQATKHLVERRPRLAPSTKKVNYNSLDSKDGFVIYWIVKY